jgi:hypothetical protein
MKRSRFESIVTEKTLHLINGSDQAMLMDMISSDPDYQSQLKNVCAKLPVQLSDKIDSVCGMLDISKRTFIEAALIQAVEQAEAVMHAEGLFDHLTEAGYAVDRSTTESEGKA